MLFRQYDKDRSGSLDDGELKTAVRATLKLPPAALPDAAIEALKIPDIIPDLPVDSPDEDEFASRLFVDEEES